MHRYAEERAAAAQLALRIQGFPTVNDSARLAEWLEGFITIRRSDSPTGYCLHRPDGSAAITVPDRLDGWGLAECLIEEVGHAVMGSRGAHLGWMAGCDPRLARLARAWEQQDEFEAEQFMAAWQLPSHLLAELMDDHEVAQESGCSISQIRQRRADLRGRVVKIARPPEWSARHHCRVVHCQHPVHRWVSVEQDNGPALEFPVSRRDYHETRWRINADLWAMTAKEFRLAYRWAECRRDDASMTPAELLA